MKLSHAHAGPCIIPPQQGYSCPGPSGQSIAAFPLLAAKYAYDVLANLTTEQFSAGGDRNARVMLRELIVTMGGEDPDPESGWWTFLYAQDAVPPVPA